MEASPVAARRRQLILTILIVVVVLYLASLLPAAMAIMVSPMLFDSGESPEAWAMMIGMLSYPVWVLIAVVGSCCAYAKRRHGWMTAFLLLPIPGVLLAGLAGALILAGGS